LFSLGAKTVRAYFAIFVSFLLTSCYVPGRGYVESEFDLVLESRFPRFFHAPLGARLADYSARVTCYSSPSTMRVVIRDRSRGTVFDQTCPFRWHPSDSHQGHGQIVYPSHMVLSYPSGVDILEQRAPEPRLFLSDDKAMWDAIAKAPNQAMQRTALGAAIPHLW
jgi:hypothetical protein